VTTGLLTGHRPGTSRADYVVTPEGVTLLGDFPPRDRGPALDTLIALEVLGQRLERVPDRVADLLHRFGFEWEPLSEPGHMRMLDHAAFLHERAREHAAHTAAAAFGALDVPCATLDGVSLVDAVAPVMRDYLTLTAAEPELYGAGPYEITRIDGSYLLRQTSCIQKYSVCRDRPLAAASLPVALFEISDSFRREPEETLQLSYRLRRFHLPEAHVHSRRLAEAVDLSLLLHQRILRVLAELAADAVLLVNQTHRFFTAYPDYVVRLVEQAGCPALLRVAAPGQRCQDGVEVDVEYKLIDALGCCRELSTFQIDEEITRRFGVRCDDGNLPTTIHAVLTGGVERYVFLALDGVARAEAAGRPRHLPLWLSPVVARVVPVAADAVGAALTVADRLVAAGIRADVDDRGGGPGAAVADADALLVPVLIEVDEAAGDGRVRVHRYGSAESREERLDHVVAELRRDSRPGATARPPRLSRRPFAPPRAAPRRQGA
jgi:threonyl-tRNA synthetase